MLQRMSWRYPVATRTIAWFCVVCSVILAGCRAETPTSERPTDAKKEGLPAHTRFVPTGANPEVALDTDTGTLCRTVPAQPSQHDAYTKLPLCTAIQQFNGASLERVIIDSSEWEKAEIEASCSRDKGSLPSYPVDNSGTKQITTECIIRNRSNRNVPFNARPPKFEAVVRVKDGSTVRANEEIYLASSKTEIPAHGEIVGGLFVDHSCDVRVANVDCLEAGLMNATELFLTDLNTGIHYRVRIDRP